MQRRKSTYRTAILELVNSRQDHFSASDVYDALRSDHPRISLGTVYRNLSLLAQNGNLNSFKAPDGVERFEAVTSPHIHFVCTSCGAIYDIHSESACSAIRQAVSEAGHIPTMAELQVTGLCQACSADRPDVGSPQDQLTGRPPQRR